MLKLMLCCTLCLLEWEENRATASIHQNQSLKSRANSPKLINHANGVNDGLCSISAEFIDRLLLLKWLCIIRGPRLRGCDGSRADGSVRGTRGSREGWEKWRGMWWNQATEILSPSFSPQWDPRPTAESSRRTRFKISANQSVILPSRPCPYVLLQRPFTAVPRGSPSRRHAAVQRITSRCLFFEMRLSCEMSRKHTNTNWHLILQAPQRCQLCRQRGAAKRVCCVEGEEGQGGGRVCQGGFLTGSEVQWRQGGQTGGSLKKKKGKSLSGF